MEPPENKEPGTLTSERGAPSMVSVEWRGEQKFSFGRPDREWAMVDGRGQAGPSPFDALLGAIATCAAIDVVAILEKRRTPVRTMHIEVVGMRADSVPRRLTAAEIVFRIAGEGIDRPNTERAIDLAVEKYCSVRSSVDPGIPITWRLDLEE
jgi:putative redox protein